MTNENDRETRELECEHIVRSDLFTNADLLQMTTYLSKDATEGARGARAPSRVPA